MANVEGYTFTNTAECTGDRLNTTIRDASIDLANNATGEIGTDNIADLAITTAKLATDAVTNAKVANNAIDTAELATDAVTGAKIEDDAVGTEHIADGAVTADKISSGASIFPKATVAQLKSDGSSSISMDVTTSITLANSSAIRVTCTGFGSSGYDRPIGATFSFWKNGATWTWGCMGWSFNDSNPGDSDVGTGTGTTATVTQLTAVSGMTAVDLNCVIADNTTTVNATVVGTSGMKMSALVEVY